MFDHKVAIMDEVIEYAAVGDSRAYHRLVWIGDQLNSTKCGFKEPIFEVRKISKFAIKYMSPCNRCFPELYKTIKQVIDHQ